MKGFMKMEMQRDNGLRVETHLEDVGLTDKAKLLHAFCRGLGMQKSEVLLLLTLIDKMEGGFSVKDMSGADA